MISRMSPHRGFTILAEYSDPISGMKARPTLHLMIEPAAAGSTSGAGRRSLPPRRGASSRCSMTRSAHIELVSVREQVHGAARWAASMAIIGGLAEAQAHLPHFPGTWFHHPRNIMLIKA